MPPETPSAVLGVKPVYLRKRIMRSGSFYNADGEIVSVPRERLIHWAETFRAMQTHGVPCPLCKDHDDCVDSTIGRIISMEVEGDYLTATLELPPEYEHLTQLNDVSISTKNEYITGTSIFHDAIKHVSLTPIPRITRLGGYEKVNQVLPELVCSLADQVPKTKGKKMNESLAKLLDLLAAQWGLEVPEEAKTDDNSAFMWAAGVINAKAPDKPEEKPEDKTDIEASKETSTNNSSKERSDFGR